MMRPSRSTKRRERERRERERKRERERERERERSSLFPLSFFNRANSKGSKTGAKQQLLALIFQAAAVAADR
jgi:hypothetical protein